MYKWFMGVFSNQSDKTSYEEEENQLLNDDPDPYKVGMEDDEYEMEEYYNDENEAEAEYDQEYHDDVIILDPHFYGNADR